MKKTLSLIAGILLASAVYTLVNADTGREGATRIERGSYVESRVVDISTTGATAIIPPSNYRPDSLCKNFSSYTVYIGSAASGTYLNTIGLPVGASEYFKIDGSFTGSMSAIAEPSATNVKVICLDGLVQRGF